MLSAVIIFSPVAPRNGPRGSMALSCAPSTFQEESLLFPSLESFSQCRSIYTLRTNCWYEFGMAGQSFERNSINDSKVHFGNNYYTCSTKSASELSGIAETTVAQHWLEPSLSKGAGAYGLNELYCVPRCSRPQFVGRQLLADIVKKKLNPDAGQMDDGKHMIAAIYGLGGSGKTQFCLRYAEANRSR